MPTWDKDTPDRSHADRIRLERGIMETFGATRTQARNALKGIEEFRRQINEQRGGPSLVVNNSPRIDIATSELQQSKLHAEPGARASGGVQSPAASGAGFTITLSKNGIPTDFFVQGYEIV